MLSHQTLKASHEIKVDISSIASVRVVKYHKECRWNTLNRAREAPTATKRSHTPGMQDDITEARTKGTSIQSVGGHPHRTLP
jgi:hypothetical protein